jgi:hypothetical protein
LPPVEKNFDGIANFTQDNVGGSDGGRHRLRFLVGNMFRQKRKDRSRRDDIPSHDAERLKMFRGRKTIGIAG